MDINYYLKKAAKTAEFTLNANKALAITWLDLSEEVGELLREYK